jgi:hypothetical protein
MIIITDEKELAQQLGGMYDDVRLEIKGQYPEQNVVLLKANVEDPKYDNIYTHMAFTIDGKDDLLYVTTSHSVCDTYDGYIDEFYEDKKDTVLGYLK